MIRTHGLLIILILVTMIAALSGSRLARRMLLVSFSCTAIILAALWLLFGKA